MIRQLQSGLMPDKLRLDGLVSAALVKKTAIVKLPPQFWYEDPKMNPVSIHLLWACLVLGDKEKFALVEGILSEEWLARGRTEEVVELELFVEEKLYELLSLITDHRLRRQVVRNIKNTLPVTRYRNFTERLAV
jgi:hypothetical protein